MALSHKKPAGVLTSRIFRPTFEQFSRSAATFV
jgi:hypothetical protein